MYNTYTFSSRGTLIILQDLWLANHDSQWHRQNWTEVSTGRDGILHHPPARQMRVCPKKCHCCRLVVHIPDYRKLCLKGWLVNFPEKNSTEPGSKDEDVAEELGCIDTQDENDVWHVEGRLSVMYDLRNLKRHQGCHLKEFRTNDKCIHKWGRYLLKNLIIISVGQPWGYL